MTRADRMPKRLGDLWWLLAHDERGHRRIGRDHFAVGLGAAALGEALTQPSTRLLDTGVLVPDPVVGQVLVDLRDAATAGYERPARVWVEWLSEERHASLTQHVQTRLAAGGWLARYGSRVAPIDSMTAFAPVATLLAALGSDRPAANSTRVLAGIVASSGMAPLVTRDGEDTVRPLQLLAMQLPASLYALVTATDDAIHALAIRHR